MAVSALVLAAESTHLGLFVGLMGFGFLLGSYGHVIHSKLTIITGILVIGCVSGYFVLVVMMPFAGSGG